MWSSTSLTALSSGLHSCLSKSDWSCCFALSASSTNCGRVLKASLQTSQYAALGVPPMNLTILRFRSSIATSLQGVSAESNEIHWPDLFTPPPGLIGNGIGFSETGTQRGYRQTSLGPQSRARPAERPVGSKDSVHYSGGKCRSLPVCGSNLEYQK